MLRRHFATKPVMLAQDAVKNIQSGSVVLAGGFGLCGVPFTLLKALQSGPAAELTVVSNNAGTSSLGLGPLLASGKVKRMVCSYIGENPLFEKAYLGGQLELELCPQGTLSERLRAAAAGIPAFYTRCGVDTDIMSGGSVIKYGSRGTELMSTARECRSFNGRVYQMESSLPGDYALIRAHAADREGNLIFRGTARNFNLVMAKAAKYTIVEVDEIVENGEIGPDDIHLPGVYVDSLVKSTESKQIERKVLRKPQKSDKGDLRAKLAWRGAQEFSDGIYVNLGIGMPMMCARFAPKNVNVMIQSENGVLGLGDYPTEDQVDADIINAGKETATVVKGGSFFPSEDAFAMIRGGHIDLTILGAMQVSQNGDLANWIIPNKLVKGMGGAMDLASVPSTRVVILMEHCTKNGEPKILEKCTLPLTAPKCVKRIITDLGVFDVSEGKLILQEVWKGTSIDEIKSKTGCKLTIGDVKEISYED